jgi:hypothetical protein
MYAILLKEINMLSAIGVLINLGVVAYLGYQLAQCIGPDQIAGLNTAQNPLLLSFVAVVAMFIALRS